MSTLLLLTQFKRSKRVYAIDLSHSHHADTPLILDGRGVLQLLMVLVSRQRVSELSSANFLASASLHSTFPLFLINRKAYLNLALLTKHANHKQIPVWVSQH